MAVKIRAANVKDFKEWARMRHALWPTADSKELEKETAEFSKQRPDQICFVAENEKGELTGFIEVSLRSIADGCDSSPVGYIEGWFVKEPARSRGVGHELVKKAEDWARARGCTEMASDAEIDNPISIAVHEKLGFQEVSRVVTLRKFL